MVYLRAMLTELAGVIACNTHPEVKAAWQLTVYERQEKPLTPKPIWRGFACEPCLDEARKLLKTRMTGRTLLLIWPVKK